MLERLNTTSCILVGNVLQPNYLIFAAFFFVLPCILITIIMYVLIYMAMRKVVSTLFVPELFLTISHYDFPEYT